jgi:predicted short-subunit dehydrogenase-like oxidoreductase (DUF2520 family)
VEGRRHPASLPDGAARECGVLSARIIGNGRAGASFAGALTSLRICEVLAVLGRDDDPTGAAQDVDLVLIAVPDAAVADVASAIHRNPDAVIAHCSGSLGLAPLAGHWRRAVIHPLMSLPNAESGESALRGHGWFGLSADGDHLAGEIVRVMGGHPLVIAEEDWATYHACAVIASNHFVGLMGQVERLAASIGAPIAAYLSLASTAWGDVMRLGPAEALTGPVARGDWATVERHLAALPDDERAAYQAGVDLCRRLLPPE